MSKLSLVVRDSTCVRLVDLPGRSVFAHSHFEFHQCEGIHFFTGRFLAATMTFDPQPHTSYRARWLDRRHSDRCRVHPIRNDIACSAQNFHTGLMQAITIVRYRREEVHAR